MQLNLYHLAIFLLLHAGYAVLSVLLCRDRALLYLSLVYILALALFSGLSLTLGLLYHPADILPGDGQLYYDQAVILSDLGLFSYQDHLRLNYFGYQLMLGAVFTLFEPSIFYGVAVNNGFLVLTAFLLYLATHKLSGSRSAAFHAALVFCLTPVFISYSILLQKDPVLLFAGALLLLAMARLAKNDAALPSLFLLALAFLILMTHRGALVPLMCLALFYFCSALARKRLLYIAASLVCLPAFFAFADGFTTHSLDTDFYVSAITDSQVIRGRLDDGRIEMRGIVANIASVYDALPFFLRIVAFGVPVMVQFFLPIDFWDASFLTVNAAYFFSKNLAPLWFLFVGAWCLFAVLNLRSCDNPLLRRLTLIGAVYYCAIAVVYSGAIPRYAMAGVVFVYPAVGYWWSLQAQQAVARLKVRRFFFSYYVFLLVAFLLYIALKLRALL